MLDKSLLDMAVPLVALSDVERHQPDVVSKVTLLSFVQEANAFHPINRTLDGIVIDARAEQ